MAKPKKTKSAGTAQSDRAALDKLGKVVKKVQLRSGVRAGMKGAKTQDDDKIFSAVMFG